MFVLSNCLTKKQSKDLQVLFLLKYWYVGEVCGSSRLKNHSCAKSLLYTPLTALCFWCIYSCMWSGCGSGGRVDSSSPCAEVALGKVLSPEFPQSAHQSVTFRCAEEQIRVL